MKRLTRDEVINGFKKIHGNRYDYSNVIYINAHTKVKITCPEHGEFEQEPNNHKYFGCIKCGFSKTGESQNIDVELLLKQFINVHGNRYDYSKINYFGDNVKIKIVCSIHGEFEQTPSNHKRGWNCSKCGGRYVPTNNEIIDEFKTKHGDNYDYSMVEYKNHHTKVKIMCLKHGEFEQEPNSHKRGSGCPSCNESKGEKIISKLLNENNISYNKEFKFSDCKDKKELPFDFYLPDHNVCIEFNGIQHYKPIDYFGGEIAFKKQQKRDNIKKEYCLKNNIPLIIIKYDEEITTKLIKML